MNRRLAEAVIATFREDDRDILAGRLANFGARDWRHGLHWLDASGLALYFLDRLRSLGLQDAIPPEIAAALDSRLTDNRQRTADLFSEFVRINQAFQADGLQYVNLKGFTLAPDYCPDPALRCQFDLDFLVSSSDAGRCNDILGTFGYALTGRGDNIREYKAGSPELPSVRDLYKPRASRAVEVHFLPSTESGFGVSSDSLGQWHTHTWNGATFPSLTDTDIFLAQANHLLRHLRSEWTRISWLLEFKSFVSSRREDAGFWSDVLAQAKSASDGILSIGVATWLATEAFGDFAPRSLVEGTVDVLPAPVRLWLERYGKAVLFSDFPGSKLYLLLNAALSADAEGENKAIFHKVLPLHRPPQVVGDAGGGFRRRLYRMVVQARYVMFRLRFHLMESSRYLLEAWKWKLIAKASGGNQPLPSGSVADLSALPATDR